MTNEQVKAIIQDLNENYSDDVTYSEIDNGAKIISIKTMCSPGPVIDQIFHKHKAGFHFNTVRYDLDRERYITEYIDDRGCYDQTKVVLCTCGCGRAIGLKQIE